MSGVVLGDTEIEAAVAIGAPVGRVVEGAIDMALDYASRTLPVDFLAAAMCTRTEVPVVNGMEVSGSGNRKRRHDEQSSECEL